MSKLGYLLLGLLLISIAVYGPFYLAFRLPWASWWAAPTMLVVLFFAWFFFLLGASALQELRE